MNPNQEKKQLLKELIEMQKSLETRLETQEQMIKRFQVLTEDSNLFVQIIDYFPYPVIVFSPDGMLEVCNHGLLAAIKATGKKTPANHYNILAQCTDSQITDAARRALSGETVFLYDLEKPLKTLGLLSGATAGDKSTDAVFFPVTDNGTTSHAVAVFIHHQM